jgi:serine/threonine-protein kinase RsbW
MIKTDKQSFAFPSVKENVALVEKLVDEICAYYNIGDEHYGNILVALTEAVSNAIYHGNELNPDKLVEFYYESKNGMLCFTIADEGKGYDPEAVPDPTDPQNIELPNGRGVFLMKKLTDGIAFHDNGRKIELQFRLTNQ